MFTSNTTILCASAMFSLCLAGCGDDDHAHTPDASSAIDASTPVDANATPDAEVPAIDAANIDAAICSAALTVLDDGSGASGAEGIPNIVISEINPGDYVEVFNTTNADISTGDIAHQLCSPFAYASLSSLITTVIPAGGFATIPWPSNFVDVDAGGEVILYSSGSFGANTAILDFACWGTNPHGTRKGQAEAVGKWTGDCAAALGAGALHRVTNTTGSTSSSYDTTGAASPLNCAP